MNERSAFVRAIADVVDWKPVRRAHDFREIEREIGFTLPEDYKEFITAFPPGSFNDALIVIQTRADEPNVTLRDLLIESLTPFRLGLEDDLSEIGDLVLYPDANGLVPWGYVDAAWTFAWQTSESDPDSWPSFVCSNDLDFMLPMDGPMAQCVLDLITGAFEVCGVSLLTETVPRPSFYDLKSPS